MDFADKLDMMDDDCDIEGFPLENEHEELIIEERIRNMTAECWNLFNKLKPTHPSDLNDFAEGIHQLQKIMAMRIVRRDHPDIFPVK